MPERFRANIFTIEKDRSLPSFEEAIKVVVGMPQPQRNFAVNGMDRRLEHHQPKQGCHLLNFVTLRFMGPGRATPDQAVKPFRFGRGETFAYQSSMLHDPQHDLVLIESTRPGMGAGAVGRYFGHMGVAPGKSYKLRAVLDQEARNRALRNQEIRSVELGIEMGPGGSRDSQLDSLTALSYALGGDYMDIVVTVAPRSRGRSLVPNATRALIERLIPQVNDGTVDKLKLKGRLGDDDPLEVIDLLQHREWRERELDVDRRTRNIPHEKRWQTLLDIHRDYLS